MNKICTTIEQSKKLIELEIDVKKFNSVQDVPFEQKPWSEEDEQMLNDAISAVGAADYYTYDDKHKIEDWLKSLKQRIGG